MAIHTEDAWCIFAFSLGYLLMIFLVLLCSIKDTKIKQVSYEYYGVLFLGKISPIWLEIMYMLAMRVGKQRFDLFSNRLYNNETLATCFA